MAEFSSMRLNDLSENLLNSNDRRFDMTLVNIVMENMNWHDLSTILSDNEGISRCWMIVFFQNGVFIDSTLRVLILSSIVFSLSLVMLLVSELRSLS